MPANTRGMEVTGGAGSCRVPEECPQAIADLYQACTGFDARKRPKASEVMRVIEGSMLAIPGAPDSRTSDSCAPCPKEG